VKRLSFWVFQILAWGAYGLSTYLSDLPSLVDAEMFSMLGSKLIRATLGMGLSLVLYMLYRRLLDKSRGIQVVATVAVLASLLVSAFWQFLYRLAVEPQWNAAVLSIDWSSFRMAAPDYAFVMLAWSAAYLGIEFWRYSRIQERRALEARALAQEAQLKSLSYQLNPHFLFNALNSIRALILEDAARARQMVTQLSEFLRHTLVSAPLNEIPLRDELEALRRYLEIEKTRFEERLELTIDVDPEAADCAVPGLILHPFGTWCTNRSRSGRRDCPRTISCASMDRPS
jgi:hypothetical protein